MKPVPIVSKAVSQYWMTYYLSERGVCSLCGNRGRVTTLIDDPPFGLTQSKTTHYCICPNGQAMRKQKGPL